MNTPEESKRSPEIEAKLEAMRHMAEAMKTPSPRELYLFNAGRLAFNMYKREQRRFYASVLCNLVLLVVIWVAL